MDPRAKIPVLALVGLQFTQGCGPDDPIVGVWSATQIGEQAFPVSYSYMDEQGAYGYTQTVELHIGEELRGQFVTRAEQSSPDIDAYYEVAQDLTVDREDAPTYRIEVSQAQIGGYEDPYVPGETPEPDPPLVLSCELAADRLRCKGEGDGGVEMRFKRAE